MAAMRLMLFAAIATAALARESSPRGFLSRASQLCPFAGQSVIITGGTQGIGKAAAQEFIRYGAARVHIVGRSKSRGAAARQQLLAFAAGLASESMSCVEGGADLSAMVQYHSLDVGSFGLVTSAMQDLLNSSSFRKDMCRYPLKYAVNAATLTGPVTDKGTFEISPEFMQNTWNLNAFRVNTEGNLWSVAAEWAYFRDLAKTCGKAGEVMDVSIVSMSSLDGIRGCPTCAVYSMTKYSINGLVNSVALEARDPSNRVIDLGDGKNLTLNLRINSVLPGLVSTPFTWNQARLANGMQMFQCCDGDYRNATVKECADAISRGEAKKVTSDLICEDPTECACPNVAKDDPSWAAAFTDDVMADLLQPEQVAGTIISVSNNVLSAAVSGSQVATDFGSHNK